MPTYVGERRSRVGWRGGMMKVGVETTSYWRKDSGKNFYGPVSTFEGEGRCTRISLFTNTRPVCLKINRPKCRLTRFSYTQGLSFFVKNLE